MAVSIKLDDIVKRFGKTVAVDHVSIEISPGELFFLLGPSGCGKTTLLRAIAGFGTPDEGRVLFDGADITNLPPHKRDTGMVFQSYALWPHMTVAQNVAFGLEMRKVPREEAARRVAEAIAMVQMTERAERKPNQLSGGQQQRVALARALVVHPRCILLDEPLSNLDAKLRHEMRTEIRRICKDAGLTSIYVTHDQKEALSIADRIAIMRDGKVEQIGAPMDVYRSPANSFVAGFIGDGNFIDAKVAGVGGDTLGLATSIGVFCASRAGAATKLAEGDAARICIRPEALRFGDEFASGGCNVLKGKLMDTVYLGEIAQHNFVVGEGDSAATLKAYELNPRRVAREAAVGAVAYVAPDDVIALPE